MSEDSIQKSEYYREDFDPTLHPFIYKMINLLSPQANDFQKAVDPIYDYFLVQRISTKIQKTSSTSSSKRYMGQRQFAGLSILTCGNSDVIGFSNVGHVDNDFITLYAGEKMLKVLQELWYEYNLYQNESILQALLHLHNKYIRKKRFSTYTACGYKVLLDERQEYKNFICQAYFLYNTLLEAVQIPTEESCYHTFDASYTNHQTSVPLVENEIYVYFGHQFAFVFAWGNGKSEKRKYMEEQGFTCEGRVTNTLITDFFNRLSTEQQDYMTSKGWYAN